MRITCENYSGGKESNRIMVIVKSGLTTVCEVVMNITKKVDKNLIADLRNVAEELENQNRLVAAREKKEWDDLHENIFVTFLKREKIYELFERHFLTAKHCHWHDTPHNFETHVAEADADSIKTAFRWCRTAQGEVFWDKMDQEWRAIYNQHIREINEL